MNLYTTHPTANISISPTFQPKSYTEMDVWLNSLSPQQWLAFIGAFTAGGTSSIIDHLRGFYQLNVAGWKDKDLRHYWEQRNLSDFKTKFER